MSDDMSGLAVRAGELTVLADAVRRRIVSAEELVRESLRRIDAARDLNAVVTLRADEALADARALDARVAAGEDPGPLAGLPVLVKDIEDAAGMPTTFGSLLFAAAPPALRDGVVASRLRAAGGVVIGKTNTPEFAFEGYTANPLFGVTRNPWAPAWSPGGSSGGSAAALAAGLAPIATATDVGGSIRIPASACGLVGYKPTAGHIGRDPILGTPDMNHHGPITTTVADARLLVDVLAGPVAGDPFSLPRRALGPARRPSRFLAASRIVPGFGPLPAAVEEPFEAALEAVSRDLGIAVERVAPEEILPSGYEGADYLRVVGTEQVAEIGRARIEASADLLDPVFLRYARAALALPPQEYAEARIRRYRYARELDALLGDDAVLLTPTLGAEGWSAEGRLPSADEPGVPSAAYNTELQNFTGHPAISLPAGRGPSGVPFGLQVTGPRREDELLLWFAEAWEAARPWPLVAPGYRRFGWGLVDLP